MYRTGVFEEIQIFTADLSLTKSLSSLYQEEYYIPLAQREQTFLIYAKEGQANKESKGGLLLSEAPSN